MEDDEALTTLEYRFCFWFSYFKESKMKQVDGYEDYLHRVGDFNTAEEFWGFYQHMRRPDSLPKGCEFYLFKEGIKPLWEDTANKGGGRFVLHIKKMFANKTWEDILIGLLISDSSNAKINGLVINVRSWEVLLSVWTSSLDGEDEIEKYKAWIKKTLKMSKNVQIDYKEHPNPQEMKTRQSLGQASLQGPSEALTKQEGQAEPAQPSKPEEKVEEEESEPMEYPPTPIFAVDPN